MASEETKGAPKERKGIPIENKYVTVPTAAKMIKSTKNTIWKMLKDRRFTRYRQDFDPADHALVSVKEILRYQHDRDNRYKVIGYSSIYEETSMRDRTRTGAVAAEKESLTQDQLTNEKQGNPAEKDLETPETDYHDEDWYKNFTDEERALFDAGREENRKELEETDNA